MNQYVIIAFLVLFSYAGFATWQWNSANTALGVAQEKVRGRDSVITQMQETQVDSNEIASLAANACRSTIQVNVRHHNEAQTIRTDPGGAAAAYDRILCQRPEAVGHPRCPVSR